jgi:diacylglycerol kinase family enzyme
MNIVVVYNPKSGSALTKSELRAKCAKHNIVIDAFVALDDSLEKKLAPFIKRHATIAAVGGDGTLSAVAGQMFGSKAIFVPLPGGTLNHFTKDLGVPQDMDKALAALSHLKPKAVDAATINGQVFINNSSVGLYPSSLHLRKRLEDYLGKWPAAIIAALRSLVRFRVYTVTINDETFKTPFVFVGNNEYILDQPGIMSRKNIDKGVLSIFIVKTVSRAALLKVILFAVVGKTKGDDFEVKNAPSLTIKTTKKYVSISRDGEVTRLSPPLHFQIHKGALHVLVDK